MKRKFTKITSCLLCLAMLFSMAMPALAVRADDDAIPIDAPAPDEDGGSVLDLNDFFEDAEASLLANENPFDVTGEYEIYPTPHSVTYADSTVTLPATMPVVYTGDIDSYTKDRAVEAFKEAGVTLSESASPSGVALRVSIKADGDGVTAETPDLFAKNSAYKLTIDANGVTVVGVDTDAAFYGLTTVKRILQQVTNKRVKHLTVEDYADVPFRGFIEGYYGQPWTVEDRIALMEFGGELKMNIYFYAPKDDPKHNAQWRVPYSDEEIEQMITPMAEAGERTKCRFGYALHCFMNSPFRFDTQEHYDEDLAVLEAKYEQGIKAGARQIALLADDAGIPSGTLGSGNHGGDGYVKLLNDLTDWLASEEMQTKYPGLQTTIPFCPQAYDNGDGNYDQLKKLNEAPEGVSIIMTGGAVYKPVDAAFLNAFKSNVGREAYLWVNWPCSDNVRARLMMLGQDKFLKPNVVPGSVEGIMLNPMQQSEPSKVGLFCNADYAWNLWTDEQTAFKVWDDSFKYVEKASAVLTAEEKTNADALRLLSQHMGYNIDSRPPKTDESQYMWDKMTAFRSAMNSNSLTAEQIEELRGEYQAIYDAAVRYKNKTTGNMRILGKRGVDGAAFYPMQQEQMAPWLDCAEDLTAATLDLLDALSLSLENADGTQDNAILQKYLSAQQKLTASQNHDYWNRSGIGNFTVKPEFGGQRLIPFANDLLTKVAETAQTIVDPNILIERIITNRDDTPEGGLEAVRDGDDSTAAVFKDPNSVSEGTYIGVQYNKPISLNSVRFEMGRPGNANDRFSASKLQYMDENGTWTDIPDATFGDVASVEKTGLALTTMGVRLVATADRSNVWLGVKEIYVNGKSGAETEPELATGQLTGSVIRTADWGVYEGAESNLTDGNDSTIVYYDPDKSGQTGGRPADTSVVDDYIGLDFGRVIKNVGRVRFVVGDGSDNDKWTNFKLQYSVDGTTWIDSDTYTSPNTKDVIEKDLGGVEARYVRFANTVQIHKWLRFGELSVWADEAAAAARIIYQSDAVKKVTNPVAALSNSEASLTADNVMLRPGEFVGVALPKVRAITDIVADFTPVPGLVLKAGLSEAELYPVDIPAQASAAQLFAAEGTVIDYNAPARYVRLENEGQQTISFQLNKLAVHSDAIENIHLEEDMTNMGINSGYVSQDNRQSLNFFDGDMSTVTTLANEQAIGEYVTYDLGQLRSIKKLTMAMSENATNYLRHGVLEVSPTGADGTWTTVLTVNNDGAFDASVKDGAASDPSFKLGVPSQNNVAFVGELAEPVQARYLRIRVTGTTPEGNTGSNRFVAASEILINTESLNDMEYVSAYSDATIVADPIEPSAEFTPDKMRDGDLTTGFKPNMDGVTSGSLVYRLSDETSIGQINLVQGETSGVKLSIRPVGETQFQELATLSGGLSQTPIAEDITGVAEIKLTWGNVTPTFYELITISRAAVAESGGQASSEVETIPINSYSGDARKVNFDENWKFNLGDVSGAEAQVFNDSAWRTLNLPHDFSIEQEYSGSCDDESGYLPGGTGWYRKSFTVDPSWENKTVSIDFGGAYMDTDVYLNGHKLGEYHYGYTPFSFVLPNEYMNYTGENVIAVKVVNAVPTSRWYSGSGLYRSVNLTVTNPVHVARYGTYVNPVNSSGNSWMVNINTTVQNDAASNASVTVEQAIYELNAATYEKGAKFAETSSAATVSPAAGASASVAQTISVQNPKLWNSWDKGEPNLYVLVTTVKQGGTVVDTYETEFGFRTIEFTVNDGFKLNGENVKLKGVCQHHDQGALGSEAWYRALERQVDILMEMGCNSIRVTHNPAADELIEICNRKGILIIDEFFDMWTAYKNGNSNDFARWFNVQIADTNTVFGGEGITWAQLVVETTVGRDQNSPCVIMYSIGNELTTQTSGSTAQYPSIASNIIQWTQAMDRTRPLTMGDNNKNPGDSSNTLHQIDQLLHEADGVVGYNYAPADTLTSAHNLGWKMYGSETASAVNSRGVYDRKNSNSDGGHGDYRLTSYDKSSVGWGSVASEAWWRTIRFDYNAGEYVWTGFDYIGEPTPWISTGVRPDYNDNIAKSSFFGIIDTNGIPKDSYYMYRAMWMEDGSTTLHVLPTWDEQDLMLDSNGKVEVVVYSNAPVVKVYLNGREVGTATSTEQRSNGGLYTYRTFTSGTGCYRQNSEDESLYATFNVPYEAGTLEVKAYQANGVTEITDTVGRDVVRTTDGAKTLVTTADRKTIKNDGRDLSYVTIDVVDAKGEIVNSADNQIKVSVTGDGVLVGMDNGVQGDHTSYQSDTRKAGAGRLVAIIQSTKDEGSFTVTATSPGLTPSAVTVSTGGVTAETGGTAPVSYDLSKTIYVQLNAELDLPTTTTVTLGNGKTVTGNIQWKDYDSALLGQIGDFAIAGTITIPGYTIPVSVGVVVLDDVAALLNYSAAVQVGQVPSLPAARPAVMADGTVVSAQFEVDWDLPEDPEEQAKLFRKAGKVIVNGTAEVFGEIYNVTATIRVAVGEVVEGDNNSSKADTLTLNGADSQPLQAIRDGDASTSWTGSGDVVFYYNTPLAMSKIKLIYDSTPPASSVMTLYVSPTGMDGSWTPRSVRPTTEGHTVTYNFNGLESAFYIKLAFASEVSLAEAELISGTPVFPVGSTAELDGMNINGQPVSETQLAAKSIKTSAINGVINPISQYNVAVTILPENKDSKIILVTESENHAQREVYTVQLDTPDELPANDDTLDYPYAQTTVFAPSEAKSGADGPDDNVIDGNTSTHWHSRYAGCSNGTGQENVLQGNNIETYHQNYIQLTLQEATELVALRQYPRNDSSNGRISDYEVKVSNTTDDDSAFTTVATGRFENRAAWQIAMFDKAVTAKYVRLYALGSYGGVPDKDMAIGELRVVTNPDSGKIDLSEAVITVEPNEFEWKNVGIRPGDPDDDNTGAVVTVTLRGKVLTLGTDYELGFENNIDPGTAYIYARAKDTTKYQGAAAATFTIFKTEAKITSFQPVTVPVQPGIDPTDSLPAKVMAFTNSADGLPMEVEVTWDAVPADWYNFPQEKTRPLTGTVDPDLLSDPDLKPTATLKFAYSQSVDSISMVTAVGVLPSLPEIVTVQFDDGTSGQRTVSQWYVKGDDTKAALTAADFATAGTVELEGDIVGINRVKASASVRVDTATENLDNIALNTSGTGIPFAMASYSSNADPVSRIIDGNRTGVSSGSKQIWCNWQAGVYSDAWVAVALDGTLDGNTYTPKPKLINKVNIGFLEEDEGNDSHKVSLPASYKVEYYTGPAGDLTLGDNKNVVSGWANSPLNDNRNWTELQPNGTKPSIPSDVSEANHNYIEYTFAPVMASIVRVVMTPQSEQWVGMEELEVYGLTPPTANSDFTVTSVTLGGEEKLGSFVTDSSVTNGKMLEVTLPANSDATKDIPKLAVTATDNASISVVQAARVPGMAQAGGAWAQAVVTSEDGSKTETYTVKFKRTGAAAGFFIELDDNFPTDKLQLVNASGKPVTGATPNAEITLQIAKGYQGQVWVEITEGDRMGEVLVLSNTNTSFLMPAASVHVYGSAMPITYNIKYLLNGGSFVGDPRVTYNVETATFSVNDPTRPGYTFKGWVGGGLTQPTTGLTIAKGSIGDRTYTAVWEINGSIGGGGGNNGGGSVSVPVGDVTVTTKNPDGSTTVTTTTSGGLVSAVTTAPDGTQSAVIQIPQNSGTPTKAVMPALDVTADKTPEVTVQNNTGRPLSVIVPVNGASTVVAVRTNADGSETVIPYSVMDENGLRVKVASDSQTLKLMDNKKTFDDVPGDHWSLGAVDFVSSRELFNGMGSASTFAPAAPMDRAMMTTVLWRLAEKPNAAVTELFADVQSGSYYEQAVAWGVATGVVKGTDNGFEPNSPVTRETLAVLLYRAAGSPAVVDELPRRFVDGAQVADWAQEAMIWCVQNDIIKGYPDNTLGAKNVATRAEVATMLQRFVIHQI